MIKYTNTQREQTVQLLKDGTAVLGMKLCFRNIDKSFELPQYWWQHIVDACLVHKRSEDSPVCKQFAAEQTNRDLTQHPRGMIRTCPFGFTEILTPVMVDGIYAGPLFAGPCWMAPSPPPHQSLIVPPDTDWLRQRLAMLNCISAELSHLLQPGLPERPLRRRQQIMQYIYDTLHTAVSLDDLAAKLNLSPSRTTHLVKEIFGLSLPLLSRQHKLIRAANELADTDLPVGTIAFRYGFLDQNYFSRIFSQHFGISPRNYRRNHETQA